MIRFFFQLIEFSKNLKISDFRKIKNLKFPYVNWIFPIFRKSEIFRIFENSISRKKNLPIIKKKISRKSQNFMKDLSGTPTNTSLPPWARRTSSLNLDQHENFALSAWWIILIWTIRMPDGRSGSSKFQGSMHCQRWRIPTRAREVPQSCRNAC